MITKLPDDVLERYADERIPRYTSYPTAPHFTPAIGQAHYGSWLSSLPSGNASIYVHVPFCSAMCWYCGCHTTVAARAEPVTRYLRALEKEVQLVAGLTRGPVAITHVHFGGGTPTLMHPDQMRSLIATLRDQFAISQDAEIAIEIDPRTLTDEMTSALAESRFTRASLGVQSFDLDVQRAINRVQSFEETACAVGSLRKSGIVAINFDLIYGLPGQSLQSCIETVEQALKLRPDRLAIFGYAHVPSFKPHQRKIAEAALPGSSLRLQQSRAMADALTSAGYIEIGLDHFALPSDALAVSATAGRMHRNFQGYTTDEAEVMIGFGASAIGRMPQGFVQNEVRIPRYEQAIADGKLPIARGYRFVADDRLRGALIERLMCDHKVDVGAICRDHGANPETLLLSAARLNELVADGLIERRGMNIVIPPHARQLVRSIASAFDAHFAAGHQHSQAV